MEAEDATREDVMEFFGDNPPAEILDDFPEEAPDTPDDEGGDTPNPDTGDDAVVATDGGDKPKDDPDNSTNTDDDPGDDEEADILSKSGKYTIPYEKLTEARDSAKASREAEEAALSEIANLKSQLEALQKGGEGDTDQPGDEGGDEDGLTEDLEELEEEFPGVAKTIKGLQEQIKTLTEAKQSAEAEAEESVAVDHFAAIEDAHENSQEILVSREFDTWLNEQPSIMKNAYTTVYQEGSTTEVIEMLDAFKEATEPEAPNGDQNETTGKDDDQAAKDVAAKIKSAEDKKSTPVSLSDVPGVPSATDPVEMLQASSNSGKAVDDLFAGKSPEQINALVNKLL